MKPRSKGEMVLQAKGTVLIVPVGHLITTMQGSTDASSPLKSIENYLLNDAETREREKREDRQFQVVECMQFVSSVATRSMTPTENLPICISFL